MTHHPLLVTVCFKKEGLVLPAEIFEVFNVDTFLISLMGEVGKAKFQSNILPSQYRFRTEGLWSKKLRYKKLRAKILTYHKLSKYFNGAKDVLLKEYYFKKMKHHFKMVIFLHIKERNFALAGKAFVNYLRNQI